MGNNKVNSKEQVKELTGILIKVVNLFLIINLILEKKIMIKI